MLLRSNIGSLVVFIILDKSLSPFSRLAAEKLLVETFPARIREEPSSRALGSAPLADWRHALGRPTAAGLPLKTFGG